MNQMSPPPPPVPPPAGWMIGVMIEADGAPAQRHYFAVSKPDRNRAEWAAVDQALTTGTVATSPSGGSEPVEAVAPLTAATFKAMGMGQGQVRALGSRWPRRWMVRP